MEEKLPWLYVIDVNAEAGEWPAEMREARVGFARWEYLHDLFFLSTCFFKLTVIFTVSRFESIRSN